MAENREDVLLAMKELKRQGEKLRRRLGDEFVTRFDDSPEGRDIQRGIEDLLAGRVTVEDASAEIERRDEALAKEIRASDDPGMISALDAENEVRAKSQKTNGAAELLAADAFRDASLGIAKEDWILEVLNGHGDDQEAQLGCLKLIAALWQDGPWPWPRTL
jgi:hypothetical protein